MNNQRLAALQRRPDMRPEPLSLPFQITFEPIVIQSGFPDGYDLGMVG
jgi:hypothetical protein